MASPRIAVLASGNGTTAESFIRSISNKEVSGEVIELICNNKNAAVFDKVNKLNKELGLNIKTVHIGRGNYPPEQGEKAAAGRQTKAEERALLDELQDMRIDLVLFLGYMKLLGKNVVNKYGWNKNQKSIYQTRMLNTHPGLLPQTKGLYGIHVQEKVISDKLQAGHSLHGVSFGYDDGPVIIDHKVKILPGDTAESLFERVKDSEKANLARDIENFIVEQKKYLSVQ